MSLRSGKLEHDSSDLRRDVVEGSLGTIGEGRWLLLVSKILERPKPSSHGVLALRCFVVDVGCRWSTTKTFSLM